MKRIWISAVFVLLCGTLVAGYRIGRARAYGIPTTSPLASIKSHFFSTSAAFTDRVACVSSAMNLLEVNLLEMNLLDGGKFREGPSGQTAIRHVGDRDAQ